VTVLVNGLPMVHIELKRRGVDIREAFNQIDRYQRDSFWAGSGLFEYVQLFVISNGTLTKYYSNTTRASTSTSGPRQAAPEDVEQLRVHLVVGRREEPPDQDLAGFTKTFFAKHTLLNMLTRYCVLTADRMLLVMRPYQIVATEQILRRIETSTNYKTAWAPSRRRVYVWHTTGSGKTLTSFKTAQLASARPGSTRCSSSSTARTSTTRRCASTTASRRARPTPTPRRPCSRSSSRTPTRASSSRRSRSSATFIAANKGHEIYDGHVVVIFDECHRSQFGDMHTAITKAFKRYHLFGFTGTPIFAANCRHGGNPQLRTTEQAFGDKLHTYTIVDAITDKNVLPFRIDYVNTIKAGDVADKQVSAIDTEKALLAPERISRSSPTSSSTSTRRPSGRASYAARRPASVGGFNALFATASIDAARRTTTSSASSSRTSAGQRLKVGLIYSTPPTRRRTTASSTRRSSRPRALTAMRASSSRTRSRTTTTCSARASTPRASGSRTTTRTCRSG
jgi:type I restriction enzyme R subunit